MVNMLLIRPIVTHQTYRNILGIIFINSLKMTTLNQPT